jgi:hypothetical protein
VPKGSDHDPELLRDFAGNQAPNVGEPTPLVLDGRNCPPFCALEEQDRWFGGMRNETRVNRHRGCSFGDTRVLRYRQAASALINVLAGNRESPCLRQGCSIPFETESSYL